MSRVSAYYALEQNHAYLGHDLEYLTLEEGTLDPAADPQWSPPKRPPPNWLASTLDCVDFANASRCVFPLPSAPWQRRRRSPYSTRTACMTATARNPLEISEGAHPVSQTMMENRRLLRKYMTTPLFKRDNATTLSSPLLPVEIREPVVRQRRGPRAPHCRGVTPCVPCQKSLGYCIVREKAPVLEPLLSGNFRKPRTPPIASPQPESETEESEEDTFEIQSTEPLWKSPKQFTPKARTKVPHRIFAPKKLDRSWDSPRAFKIKARAASPSPPPQPVLQPRPISVPSPSPVQRMESQRPRPVKTPATPVVVERSRPSPAPARTTPVVPRTPLKRVSPKRKIRAYKAGDKTVPPPTELVLVKPLALPPPEEKMYKIVDKSFPVYGPELPLHFHSELIKELQADLAPEEEPRQKSAWSKVRFKKDSLKAVVL